MCQGRAGETLIAGFGGFFFFCLTTRAVPYMSRGWCRAMSSWRRRALPSEFDKVPCGGHEVSLPVLQYPDCKDPVLISEPSR